MMGRSLGFVTGAGPGICDEAESKNCWDACADDLVFLQEVNERFLVLFPHTLLMLSASLRMSGFIYQVSLQRDVLTGCLMLLNAPFLSSGEDSAIRDAHFQNRRWRKLEERV